MLCEGLELVLLDKEVERKAKGKEEHEEMPIV